MKQLLVLFFSLGCWGLRAQDAASGAAVVAPSGAALPLDPAVRTGKLSNGLTYFIRRNGEPKNRVVLYLVNKVGSILESDQQQGLAHFMEHMSFNGTTHFPKNELIDYLQKSGVRFGADINAYTSFDETVYQLPIPSDRPELLNNGFRILRDWAQQAVLDSAEIDRERGVVLEEKRLGKGAGERMRQVYFPLILNHSRYAMRMPIGVDSVLEHFSPGEIRRFYHDWYRPDLQAVIVVGDIDVDQSEKTIRALFGDLKNPAGERRRERYTVPLTGKAQFITVTDKEVTTTQAEVMMKHPMLPLKTAADYRQQIIRMLFNQMLQQRFARVMTEPDPPYQQASAGIGGFMGGLDIFDANVTAAPGKLEQGVKSMWRETVRVWRSGFTDKELDRARTSYTSRMDAALKEKDKTSSAAYANEYKDYFLQGNAVPGLDVEYALVKKDLPGITLAEVNALAKKYISESDRDILILAPEKAVLPDSVTVTGWLKAVEAESIPPYEEKDANVPFLNRLPSGGRVTGSNLDKELGLETLTLSNGVRVLLKPTNFKNDEILFNAFAPGGSSLYSDEDYQSAANATSIIGSGGVGNYGITELQHYLTGKQAGVRPFIGERSQGVTGSSTGKDLETALQLVYAYFTEPREDTAVFRGMMQRWKASLTDRGNDPGTVFADTVSAILGGYNVRRTGPSLQKLGQIDPDKAYRIYKERFSDASAFTFTFVGSFDTASIRPLLEKYLGSLPATHRPAAARDLGISIPRGVISRSVNSGTEPKATVYMVFSGDLDYSPRTIIGLDALKETLEIRLLERLREEESGVYSPTVQAGAEKYPKPRYTFVIKFGCAPANADKLVASTLDEIAKLRRDGPSPENLDKWRAEDKTSRETALQTNGWWLGYLNRQLENGEGLHQFEEHDALRSKMSVEGLKRMANEYLDGKNYIRLQWMPAK